MSNRNLAPNAPAVDLSKPDLRTLAIVLRNPELWPPDFREWNYSCCWTCALQMVLELWGVSACWRDTADWSKFYSAFGLSNTQHDQVFHYAGRANGVQMKDVTPGMVADEIDAIGHFCTRCSDEFRE
jgi:hypothetical protein